MKHIEKLPFIKHMEESTFEIDIAEKVNEIIDLLDNHFTIENRKVDNEKHKICGVWLRKDGLCDVVCGVDTSKGNCPVHDSSLKIVEGGRYPEKKESLNHTMNQIQENAASMNHQPIFSPQPVSTEELPTLYAAKGGKIGEFVSTVEAWNKKFHENFGNVYDYKLEHTEWWVEQITQAREEERERVREILRSKAETSDKGMVVSTVHIDGLLSN